MAAAPSRRLLLPMLVFAAGAVLVIAAALLMVLDRGPGAPAPSAIGGPFRLTDSNGKAVTEDSFKGQPTLVFFGYTHCPDVCPTTLFEISEILRKLKPGEKARAIFVSVDPERDTPAILKDYLSSFDDRIVGVTGDRASLDPMLKEYRVYSKKVPGTGEDYTMDHSAIVYLMDKQMRFVNALNLSEPDKATKEIERWM
jgi:protein SCO1/2